MVATFFTSHVSAHQGYISDSEHGARQDMCRYDQDGRYLCIDPVTGHEFEVVLVPAVPPQNGLRVQAHGPDFEVYELYSDDDDGSSDDVDDNTF